MGNVAVTGASGFIGRAVTAELNNRKHAVIPIDLDMGFDIQDEDTTDYIIGMKADAVIHLAGVLGTSELFDDPYRAVDVNIKGTLRMLEACKVLKARYVGISMPLVWDNVYQSTKMCSARLASAWHRHFDVPVSHVRAYNVYGPHQKVHGVQKIVPTFATKSWAHEPLPIWGDGTQRVDLVYVGDVARMLVDAMAFSDDHIFDAGTGFGQSVSMVATLVNAITGNEAEHEYLPMRAGEHGQGVTAPGLGWESLVWKPKWDEKKFEETVRWYEPKATTDTIARI